MAELYLIYRIMSINVEEVGLSRPRHPWCALAHGTRLILWLTTPKCLAPGTMLHYFCHVFCLSCAAGDRERPSRAEAVRSHCPPFHALPKPPALQSPCPTAAMTASPLSCAMSCQRLTRPCQAAPRRGQVHQSNSPANPTPVQRRTQHHPSPRLTATSQQSPQKQPP